MNVMAAARVVSRVLGCFSSSPRHLVLNLVVLGALFSFFGCAGGSILEAQSSSSPLLFRDELHQFVQPGHLYLDDGSSRHLLQTVDGGNTTDEVYLLARSRTDRPDPLHKLKKYTGGFNLSSKHYGASVGYTGLPGYILAILWAILGLFLLLTLCCCCCFCRHRTRHEFSHGRLGYILPLIALLLFTIAAIVGSILVFTSQKKFNHELRDTLNYVVNQSQETEAGLRQVSMNLTAASNIDIAGVFTLPAADKAEILQLNSQLNNSANDLHHKTFHNRKKIKDAINIVRIVLMVVAGVMLALVCLGLLLSAVGVRSLVYLLVVLGWFLVIGTWVLCGIFIFLDNGIGDTCLAMQEWVTHPEANTSFDKFLPCDEDVAASALSNSKDYTVKIVGLVNQGLTNVANVNFPPGVQTPGSYNQSGPLVPLLCNIYGPAPDYAPVACANNTVTFATAAQVWAGYICTTNANGTCITQGRLTQQSYSQLTSAAETAGSLTSSASFLVDTANCTFVRVIFTDIRDHRCHGLKKHAKLIWVGLTLMSAGSMLSILSWIVYIRRRKYRYKTSSEKDMPIYKGISQPYSPTPPPASPAA